jgi:hypothetical protein
MNAPQDAWAKPLAKRMIDKYRTQALTYISVTLGTYSEVSGTIANTEITYAAAGAVIRSGKSQQRGVEQGHELEAWIEHETVPWPISSADQLQYLGRRWKITEIESYGSGGEGFATGEIYLSSVGGQLITTLNGVPIVLQGEGGEASGFAMYASKIIARAE